MRVHRLFGRDNPVGVARCQGEIQRGWSWCARRMGADDPSTRFISMSRKTNKYFLSWCAVLSPSATRATNPRLSAPSRRNRVAILRSRYKGQAIDVKRVGRELGVCYVLEE